MFHRTSPLLDLTDINGIHPGSDAMKRSRFAPIQSLVTFEYPKENPNQISGHRISQQHHNALTRHKLWNLDDPRLETQDFRYRHRRTALSAWPPAPSPPPCLAPGTPSPCLAPGTPFLDPSAVVMNPCLPLCCSRQDPGVVVINHRLPPTRPPAVPARTPALLS